MRVRVEDGVSKGNGWDKGKGKDKGKGEGMVEG